MHPPFEKLTPPSVLLVDDTRANLVALEALLEPLGFELVRAYSGAEAIARAAERDFAVVLMDVQMPTLDGYETTRLLHGGAQRKVPVIFVSAVHNDRPHIEAGYAAGGVDYLPKPFDTELLKAKVSSLVALHQRDEELRRQAAELEAQRLAAVRAELERAGAEAASAAKDEFLAVVSHELRTPLNAIVGWTEMLRGGQLDAERTRHALDTVLRNARLQNQLIEDLLDISRIAAGRMEIRPTTFDLVPVLAAAVDDVRPLAGKSDLQLDVRMPPEARMTGDAQRLQQVAGSLLSNAIKFSRTGGRIEVILTSDGTRHQLSVRDDGVGITAEFLPFVFDHFRQGDSGGTRTHNGLGLGLAIARHLVELHGGTVRADSDGEGRGARFTVELPRELGATVAEPRSGPPSGRITSPFHAVTAPVVEPTLAGLRVLVVDDERDTRDLLGDLLAHAGASVRVVASVAQAMRVLETDGADVVVSDLSMPKEDGFSLMRKLEALDRQRGGRRTLAIAFSAHGGAEVRERALSAGFALHVSKPCEPARLIDAIAGLARAV